MYANVVLLCRILAGALRNSDEVSSAGASDVDGCGCVWWCGNVMWLIELFWCVLVMIYILLCDVMSWCIIWHLITQQEGGKLR